MSKKYPVSIPQVSQKYAVKKNFKITFALDFTELLHKKKAKMGRKKNPEVLMPVHNDFSSCLYIQYRCYKHNLKTYDMVKRDAVNAIINKIQVRPGIRPSHWIYIFLFFGQTLFLVSVYTYIFFFICKHGFLVNIWFLVKRIFFWSFRFFWFSYLMKTWFLVKTKTKNLSNDADSRTETILER